jgi:hypothetical protein
LTIAALPRGVVSLRIVMRFTRVVTAGFVFMAGIGQGCSSDDHAQQGDAGHTGGATTTTGGSVGTGGALSPLPDAGAQGGSDAGPEASDGCDRSNPPANVVRATFGSTTVVASTYSDTSHPLRRAPFALYTAKSDSTEIHAEGTGDTAFHLYLPGHAVGTFPCAAGSLPPYLLYVPAAGDISLAAGEGDGDCTVTITEYGCLGGAVRGTFSGVFTQDFPTVQSATVTAGVFDVVLIDEDGGSNPPGPTGTGGTSGGTGGSPGTTQKCTGTAGACDTQSTSSTCGAHGCEWAGCEGQASGCSSHSTTTTCEDIEGCYWSGDYPSGYCAGTARSCSGYSSSSSCTNQNGCRWTGCHGSPRACSGITSASACSEQGCVWQ